MARGIRKNGVLELKFNEERTQALATIYPPQGDGEAVTASEVLERLKAMGVTYGVRDKAILDAIHYTEDTGMVAANVVIAQGATPQDGQDARVNYRMIPEVLSRPLPKRNDGSGLPDWFALDPIKMVKADEELAAIIPAQPGVPGKTLTWPIQAIVPKPGKPCALNAGQNVCVSDDGLHLYAMQDGYACLQGEQLVVYALRLVEGNVVGGTHNFPTGAIFLANLQQVQVRAGGVTAVKGLAVGCHLRVHGDLYLRYAENCTCIASGNIYVTQGLKNCQINTRKKIIALGNAQIVGGKLCATEGIEAAVVGSADFTATEVQVGDDQFTDLRVQEIQEELTQCEANIARISQALKPFATLAAHETLPEDKRQLLPKLQAQKRTQEARIRALHNERRALSIAAKEQVAGVVSVTDTVHPGVWIRIRAAAMQVEAPLRGVRFAEAAGGKSVRTEPLRQAA